MSREDEVVEAEPVVAEAATDEVAPDEQSADPPEQVSDPEPEPEEKVWTKEVSFSRAPAEPSAPSGAVGRRAALPEPSGPGAGLESRVAEADRRRAAR